MASSTCCIYTYIDSNLIPERVIGVVYETRAQAINFLKSEEGLVGLADVDDSSFLFTIDNARLADLPLVWSNAMSFYGARVGSSPLQIEVGIKSGESDRPAKRKRESTTTTTTEEELNRRSRSQPEGNASASSSQIPQAGPSRAKAEEQAPEIPAAPLSQPPAPAAAAASPAAASPPPEQGPSSPPSRPSAPVVPEQPEAGPSSSASRDETPKKRKFNVGVKPAGEDTEARFFSVKAKTSMAKVFQAYADTIDAEVGTLSFEFENEEEERWEVGGFESVESVGMKDGSVLEVTQRKAEED